MYIEERLERLERENYELKKRIDKLEEIVFQEFDKTSEPNIEDEKLFFSMLEKLYFPVEEKYLKKVSSNLKDGFPLRAGIVWNKLEERCLVDGFKMGMSIEELAHRHNRKPGRIKSRLKRLGALGDKINYIKSSIK